MNHSCRRCLCTTLLATAATTALLSSHALAAPVVTKTLLDPLGGSTFATGISADGSTVVGNINANGTLRAASWSGSGAVTMLATGAWSRAQGISADGSTIVGFDQPVLATDAWAYRNGVQYFLPHNFAAGDSRALNASADGSVVVGFDAVAGGYQHAVSWSNNNWSSQQDLGSLATLGGDSEALGVNADGSVIVGNSEADDGLSHAFFWQGGMMNDLGVTGFHSSAEDISADGSTIVGFRYIAGGDQRPVAFTGPGFTTVTDLGSLGGTSGIASAVSADGSVIVGASSVGGNPSFFHAFRYADGTMADINTLLTNSGVDMAGVLLTDAKGVSADGRYIVANDDAFTALSYLVFYDDGIGGITNQLQQQASVDALGRQRQAIAIQHDAYARILTGDLDRHDQSNDIGVLGLVGSVVGGVRGHLGLGHGFSFSGGVIDGTSSFGGANIGNGFLGAAALRYDSEANLGGFTPYAQIGGSFGVLSNVSFTRDYDGGTGFGTADSRLASLYARLGVTRDFETGDQVSLEAEIGNRWLSNDAYSEDFSATNPFPAAIAAGTDRQTVGKLGGSWTHPLSATVDLTLHAALGATLGGDSGLSVDTTGFGTMTTSTSNTVWGEFGAHAAWAISENATLDLYAATITGPDVGTNAHVGAGYRYKF